MAKAVINLQKESGGIVKISPVDGTGVTEVTVPESGELVTKEYVDSLKTIASGTATFDATTNNINLTGIGIGVEIGDVIQISGATDSKNNSEFTVEVITDANNIIVNQAHANKGTTKNVAARVSDVGIVVKLLAKWHNAPLGLGQDWVNVKTSRTSGTTYTNNFGRPIQVMVYGYFSDGNFEIYINGKVVKIISSNTTYWIWNFDNIIPKGATYSITGTNNIISQWEELR